VWNNFVIPFLHRKKGRYWCSFLECQQSCALLYDRCVWPRTLHGPMFRMSFSVSRLCPLSCLAVKRKGQFLFSWSTFFIFFYCHCAVNVSVPSHTTTVLCCCALGNITPR
jgi:hypothetical protein